ncbi:MAG: hypothetical protein H8M99_00155, partial [Gloeobacteraceae cyanobacterium ES-bin-144]|nr:hypothetical protein [Verrucomicrobiales bacterium]
HELFKPSLEETITYGKTEVVRVTGLLSAPVIDGGKVYRDTLILFQNNPSSEAIAATMADLKAAMIPQRYIDKLQAPLH